MLTVNDALQCNALQGVHVVAGREDLHRRVRWCRIFDHPAIVEWIQGGRDPRAQQQAAGAVLFDPGPFLGRIPLNVMDEGDRLPFPLLAAPRTLRSSNATEAIKRDLMRRLS
jgi:hypothetical protein